MQFPQMVSTFLFCCLFQIHCDENKNMYYMQNYRYCDLGLPGDVKQGFAPGMYARLGNV